AAIVIQVRAVGDPANRSPRSLRAILRNPDLRIAVKMTLACGLAYAVATAVLGVPAVAAPLVPLIVFRTPDPWTVWRGLFGRLLGVLLGVGAAVAILAVSKPTWFWVAIVVALCAVLQAIPKLGDFLVHNWQIAISAVLVLGAGPGPYGAERFLESLFGVGITILVAALVWPPDPIAELTRRVDRVAANLEHDLRSTAALAGANPREALQAEQELLTRLVATHETVGDVPKARRSLRYSHHRWSRRPEGINQVAARLDRLAALHHIVGTIVHAVVHLDCESGQAPPTEAERARFREAVDLMANAVASRSAIPDGALEARLEGILRPVSDTSDPWTWTFSGGLRELVGELTPSPSTTA
ncbi:MAG: FUSC family protein, partial [Candidatus Dormibacteraceae bacterium]